MSEFLNGIGKPDNKSFSDNVEEFVATECSLNAERGYYYASHTTKKIHKIVKKGEIPLGFADPEDSTEILKIGKEDFKGNAERLEELSGRIRRIKYTGSSMNFIISGGARGFGKSVLAAFIALDCVGGMYGGSLFCVDPQWELRFHKNANTKDAPLFKTLGLKPMAHHNIALMTPLFCSRSNELDEKLYQLNTNRMTLQDLHTMMDKHLERRDVTKLDFFIHQILREKGIEIDDRFAIGSVALPRIEEIKAYIETSLASIKKDKSMRVHSNPIYRELMNLMYNHILGSKVPYIDPIDLISVGKTPVIQTDTSNDMKPYISGYISPELRKIERQRRRAVDGQNTKIPKPITIYAEEFDTLYPSYANVASKIHLKSVYTQLRQIGIGVIGSSPSLTSIIKIGDQPSNTDDTILQHTDVFLLAKTTSEGDRKIITKLFNKNMRKVRILDRLKHIPARRQQGKPPSEFAAIRKDGTIERFWPFSSFSNFRVEQKFI